MCCISVIMATYNGERFIEQQLQSIITQLPLDSEIIISDDGSADATIQVIKNFKDTRIKIIENHKRKGTVFNFENGLKHTSGDIIFLSDQDDVWLPDKVETVKKYLQEYDLVMSDCKIVDETLEVLQDSLFASLQSGKGFLKNLISNTYMGCCMAFKKDLLKLALPFPENIPMHDIW
ncbi:MAG: glycosyltransferase family 2 protein, partial [Parafilimonas sp.]